MSMEIEYYFATSSPWDYVGFAEFLKLCEKHQLTILPYPVPLIEENGGIYAFNRPEPRRAYWLMDLKRWAALRGIKLDFDNRAGLKDPLPANYLVIAAAREGLDWVRLKLSLQEAFWSEARDIGKADVRIAIANGCGLDGIALETLAETPETRAVWKENYGIAREAGVFGSPTYRYQGEIFWGQDSLPFLERRLAGDSCGVPA